MLAASWARAIGAGGETRPKAEPKPGSAQRRYVALIMAAILLGVGVMQTGQREYVLPQALIPTVSFQPLGLGELDINFINLKMRHDRLEAMQVEFRRLKLSMSRITRIEGATRKQQGYLQDRDSCARSHITALRVWARLGLARLKRSLRKLRKPEERNLDMFATAEWPGWLARWWRPAGPHQAHLNGTCAPESDLGNYTLTIGGDWGREEDERGKFGGHVGATGFLTASAFSTGWEGGLRSILGSERQALHGLSPSAAFEILMNRSQALLVLEDDARFVGNRSWLDARLRAFFSEYGGAFDALQLWGSSGKAQMARRKKMAESCIGQMNNQTCFKVKREKHAQSTIAYIVSRSFVDTLLTEWEAQRPDRPRGATDITWRPLQQKNRWFIFEVPLVSPSGSKSSIR